MSKNETTLLEEEFGTPQTFLQKRIVTRDDESVTILHLHHGRAVDACNIMRTRDYGTGRVDTDTFKVDELRILLDQYDTWIASIQ